jgi:REP element-mobilizing transposase RayT
MSKKSHDAPIPVVDPGAPGLQHEKPSVIPYSRDRNRAVSLSSDHISRVGLSPLAINGTADHVHALFRLSRKVALCDVVEEVKKRSSKWIKARGSRFAGFQWQAGYGAFSIGESGAPALKRYVGRQKEHHRKKSFKEEFRVLLARYG